jgi:CheY-like chemotaxis protein
VEKLKNSTIISNLWQVGQGHSDDKNPANNQPYLGGDDTTKIDNNNTNKNRIASQKDKRINNRLVPDAESPHYRIMVVDDEPDIISVLTKGLQRHGFSVAGYMNPVKALADFERHKFDIVLTDIKMPQMDGVELYRHLRVIDSEVLICFISAYDHYRNAIELAFPDEPIGCFIPKPFSIDRIINTLTTKLDERENVWRRGNI